MIEHDYERIDMMDGGDTRILGVQLTSEEYSAIADIVEAVLIRAGKIRADVSWSPRDPDYYFDLIIHYEDIPELEHMYFEKWWKENDDE